MILTVACLTLSALCDYPSLHPNLWWWLLADWLSSHGGGDLVPINVLVTVSLNITRSLSASAEGNRGVGTKYVVTIYLVIWNIFRPFRSNMDQALA